MTDAPWMQSSPKAILLATDLSARCDRALDRAVQLADQWAARLVVVHALEPLDVRESRDLPSWRREPDPAEIARKRVEADLRDHGTTAEITVRVASGDPAALALDIAAKEGCELIVTGVARDQALGRMLTGSAVDTLVRKAPVPLLVVRDRARQPYRMVTVATDFSPSSRRAFEAAARLFPGTPLTLFHAYDIPFAGYLENDTVTGEFRRMGDEACDKFVAEADLPAGAAERVARVIERGRPEDLLADYAQGRDGGLTVVGSHGGGALYRALIGSTAAKIVETMPGDVLLVRDPAAG